MKKSFPPTIAHFCSQVLGSFALKHVICSAVFSNTVCLCNYETGVICGCFNEQVYANKYVSKKKKKTNKYVKEEKKNFPTCGEEVFVKK